MYRETWASINLDALSHNKQQIEEATQKSLIGVVKANAYGHGDIPIAQHLEDEGIEMIGVSSIDEALRLKDAGIKADILIFSYVDPSIIETVNCSQFVYTVPSIDWFKSVATLKPTLRLHIELNVGMNRYGVKTINEVLDILDTHHSVEGIYIHLQNPENLEVGRNQINRFMEVLSQINHPFTVISIGNAPTTLVKNNSIFTHVRMGIGMYGFRSDIENLEPVLSLYSKVLYKEHVKANESIGYDYMYVAEEEHTFGTIPIGYADGFDMRNNVLPLYINNQPAPILGKICMDQTMIRINDETSLETIVEIIGPNRTVPMISEATGMSQYVVVTPLSARVERRFYKNGNLVTTMNR